MGDKSANKILSALSILNLKGNAVIIKNISKNNATRALSNLKGIIAINNFGLIKDPMRIIYRPMI
ncbi:hypothetical protein SSABA_v1c03770 [Spiroplasma sabaudiense Ar-1343]|uniref:Uncharacterized protein n=1 Tax=Spiroplasma sabaudiense Ar-1343 TaxID=1276257 RepID=W6A9X9_9MOLU|nr:hypothetical protein [Spiroplasma sabaudiense]AHI53786.1 hypothetical protein SSABA_v1c03770 [Spiroplasma sabaudiense Ar-1343]